MKKLIWTMVLFSSMAFGRTEGSPFMDIRFDFEPYVKVEHEGKVYHLISINGMRRSTFMEKCTEAYYESCKTMFAESFIETCETVGLNCEKTVDLELYLMDDHVVYKFPGVPVTEAKRQSVLQRREFRGEF